MRGEGCPECSKEIIANASRSNTVEFVEKARVVHRDYYDYSKVNYYNNTTPVTIICPEHDEFQQLPCDHLRGAGCPKCSFSHGERLISFFLDDLKVPYKAQYKCSTPLRNFRFDFYIETPKQKFIIEYNGRQHYEPVDIFGGEERFKEQLQRDADLQKYCVENNIRLFEIKYDCDISLELNKILEEILPYLQEIVDDVEDENGELCDENTVLTE